jgi:hypothetical protein
MKKELKEETVDKNEKEDWWTVGNRLECWTKPVVGIEKKYSNDLGAPFCNIKVSLCQIGIG